MSVLSLNRSLKKFFLFCESLINGQGKPGSIRIEWLNKYSKSYIFGLNDGNIAFAELGGELCSRWAASSAAPDHHQLEAENVESDKN